MPVPCLMRLLLSSEFISHLAAGSFRHFLEKYFIMNFLMFYIDAFSDLFLNEATIMCASFSFVECGANRG